MSRGKHGKPDARGRGPAPAGKPEVKCLSSDELKRIVAKASGSITEEERGNLEAVIDTLEWVTRELDRKTLTLARLRSLLGIQSSEKAKVLFGSKSEDARKEGSTAAKGEEIGGGGESHSIAQVPPKGHGRNGAEDFAGGETVEVSHESLKPGDPCPECKKGKVYERKDRPRIVIRITGQPPIKATVYKMQTLRCHLCGKVFTARAPEGVGEAKYDEGAAIMIALLKYGCGLPFNRIHRLEEYLGVPLPASTQWEVVEGASSSLSPVYQELLRQAAQGRVVHNDDTSMRVLSIMAEIENERRVSETAGKKHKGRVGIFCSGVISIGDHRIALFFTGRKHAGENLTEVLRQRAAELAHPIHMCDGLERNLSREYETIVANCLAHARRHFVSAAVGFPGEVRHVIEVLGEVYKNDALAKERGLSDLERLELHQERSQRLMDGLRQWMKILIDEKRIEENSSLGEAISYMEGHWSSLTRFLVEPGAPLDNNACERALKKAILHRKNALFYKTENGARVGDLYMSLIYTAELAGVSPFDYLTEVLRHADDAAEAPTEWLPWNYRDTIEVVDAAD